METSAYASPELKAYIPDTYNHALGTVKKFDLACC